MQTVTELRSPTTGDYPDDIQEAINKLTEAQTEAVDELVRVVVSHVSGQRWVPNRDLLPENPDDYLGLYTDKRARKVTILDVVPTQGHIIVPYSWARSDLPHEDVRSLYENHKNDSSAWTREGELGKRGIYRCYVVYDELGRHILLEDKLRGCIGQIVTVYLELRPVEESGSGNFRYEVQGLAVLEAIARDKN